MIKALLSLLRTKQPSPESVFDPKNFTERTHMLVNVILPSKEESNLALRRIQKYCDYACQHMDDKYSERIVFALLKCSIRSGSFQEEDFSDALAEFDYRDLLMSAEFGNDIYLHKKWAEELLKKT